MLPHLFLCGFILVGRYHGGVVELRIKKLGPLGDGRRERVVALKTMYNKVYATSKGG
jgi:hypothetical protein